MAKQKDKNKKGDKQSGRSTAKGEKRSLTENKGNPPKDKIGTSGTGAKNKKDKK